jgi:hypothetical protein
MLNYLLVKVQYIPLVLDLVLTLLRESPFLEDS